MTTSERRRNDILSKHLKECYLTHNVKIPDKYNGYIIRAMEEYKYDFDLLEIKTFKAFDFLIWFWVVIAVLLAGLGILTHFIN